MSPKAQDHFKTAILTGMLMASAGLVGAVWHCSLSVAGLTSLITERFADMERRLDRLENRPMSKK